MQTHQHEVTKHVAIIGGGVAGIALALSLLHREISCTVYEKEESLLHHLSTFGITSFAANILETCVPGVIAGQKDAIDDGVLECDFETLYHEINKYELLAAMGFGDYKLSSSSENVELTESKIQPMSLQVMASILPEDTVRFGKDLMAIGEVAGGDRMLLEFGDQSVAVADIVVGCDGIFSRVREYITGKSSAFPSDRNGRPNAYGMLQQLAANPPKHIAMGRVCIIGDAAHATAPHMGIAELLALEDCFILSELLADVRVSRAPESLNATLAAYQNTRVDRGQWVVAANKRADQLLAPSAGAAGEEGARLIEERQSLMRQAHAWDPKVALSVAQDQLTRLLDGLIEAESDRSSVCEITRRSADECRLCEFGNCR